MAKTPNKKISFGEEGDSVLTDSAMTFPERNTGNHSPDRHGGPTNAELLAMSAEDVAKLPGKLRSKAAIIKAAHARKGKGPANPKGKNQYTEKKMVKDFIKNTQLDALRKLNAHSFDTIEMIMAIAQNDKTKTLDRLRALEILLAYQIAKPAVRKDEQVEGSKTFVVMPSDSIMEEEVIKMPAVQNPEGNKK